MKFPYILVAALCLTSPCRAEQRACLNKFNDPAGDLPREQTGNVIHRSLQLDRGDRSFLVETFSDMSPSGQLEGEHCLRWETLNASDDSIGAFFWPAAQLKSSMLPKGERKAISIREIVKPTRGDNDVWAFENSKAVTQSWTRPVEPNISASLKGSYSVKWTTTGEVLPHLASKDEGKQKVVELSFDRSLKEFPVIESSLWSDNVELQYSSRIRIENGALTISNNVKLLGPNAEKASFAIPVARAMEKASPARVADKDDAVRYVSVISDLQHQSAPLYSKDQFSFDVELKDDVTKPLKIYRTTQPITLKTPDGTDCFLVSTYSAIPISSSLDECAK